MGILINHWSELLPDFWSTTLCSLIALFFNLIPGVDFALLEVAPNKFGRAVVHAYIEIFRNVSLLVITTVFCLVVPQIWSKVSGFATGIIGSTLYTSAFIVETVRAGISSVGDGWMERARLNGMTYTQAMWYAISSQALKIVIPPLGNQFINLIKNSSVLAFVAGFDLMYQADVIAFLPFETINTYVVVGLFYLILALPLNYHMRHLEKKLA